jgi:hypothetical protein
MWTVRAVRDQIAIYPLTKINDLGTAVGTLLPKSSNGPISRLGTR